MYGKTVKNFRLEQGITQQELGVKIGKSKQWVSAFELGHIRLNMEVAAILADALGAGLDIFMPKMTKKIRR